MTATRPAADVLAALSSHVGAGNGITAADLAARLGLLPRMVRQLVSELRLNGHAVCGTPKTGYYIAETEAELEHTCQFLRSRALHSLALEAALRKTPLPDLIGQLHLPT